MFSNKKIKELHRRLATRESEIDTYEAKIAQLESTIHNIMNERQEEINKYGADIGKLTKEVEQLKCQKEFVLDDMETIYNIAVGYKVN